MRNEKQAERRQRGEDFQEECRRSWRQIPNLWRLRITDGGNLGTRPADELVLLEHVNLLCEEKRTDGDRFKLSMLRADQLTGLINFEKALDRNAKNYFACNTKGLYLYAENTTDGYVYCESCNQIVGVYITHTEPDASEIVIIEPTTETEGKRIYKCKACGKTIEETIPKKDKE